MKNTTAQFIAALQEEVKGQLVQGVNTNMGVFDRVEGFFFIFKTKAGERIMGDKTLQFVQIRK